MLVGMPMCTSARCEHDISDGVGFVVVDHVEVDIASESLSGTFRRALAAWGLRIWDVDHGHGGDNGCETRWDGFEFTVTIVGLCRC